MFIKFKIVLACSILLLSVTQWMSCTCNDRKLSEEVYIQLDTAYQSANERALTEFVFKHYTEKEQGALWHVYDSTTLANFGSNDFDDTLLSKPIHGLYTLKNNQYVIQMFYTAPLHYTCEGCGPLISMAILKQNANKKSYSKVSHEFLTTCGNKGLVGDLKVNCIGDSIFQLYIKSYEGMKEYYYTAGKKLIKPKFNNHQID